MKITYLGTGAAEGFPAMFCSCPYCQAVKGKRNEVRTRSQVLLNDDLLIDFPPEAYSHAVTFGIDLSSIPNILFTHSHMDHCYMHDFILRGYKYARLTTDTLHLYGNAEVNAVFFECTRREMKESVAPHVVPHTIKPYDVFSVGTYRVIALPALHSATEEVLLFYVERDGKGYLHCYDTGRLPDDEPFAFLRSQGAHIDLVSFDCTFMEHTGGVTARHMGIEDTLFLKLRMQAFGLTDDRTRYVLTHFSHNADPTRRRTEALAKEYGFEAAYDGKEIEF